MRLLITTTINFILLGMLIVMPVGCDKETGSDDSIDKETDQNEDDVVGDDDDEEDSKDTGKKKKSEEDESSSTADDDEITEDNNKKNTETESDVDTESEADLDGGAETESETEEKPNGDKDTNGKGEDSAGSDNEDVSVWAVIVKAAGHLPGEKAESDPDAITGATTANKNTHVFADTLADKLKEKGADTEVYQHFECANMSCAQKDGKTADIIVLASPTQYGKLLPKMTQLLPSLEKLDPAPAVCSVLTSYGVAPVVDKFVSDLDNKGLKTVKGVALVATKQYSQNVTVVTDDEMNTELEAFADELIGALP